MTPAERAVLGRKLREELDVYHNGSAPPGWVEIQADDSNIGRDDAVAAAKICVAVGVPESCVYVYDGERWHPRSVDHYGIIVIPAVVAWLAGLIDDDELEGANQEDT